MVRLFDSYLAVMGSLAVPPGLRLWIGVLLIVLGALRVFGIVRLPSVNALGRANRPVLAGSIMMLIGVVLVVVALVA